MVKTIKQILTKAAQNHRQPALNALPCRSVNLEQAYIQPGVRNRLGEDQWYLWRHFAKIARGFFCFVSFFLFLRFATFQWSQMANATIFSETSVTESFVSTLLGAADRAMWEHIECPSFEDSVSLRWFVRGRRLQLVSNIFTLGRLWGSGHRESFQKRSGQPVERGENQIIVVIINGIFAINMIFKPPGRDCILWIFRWLRI